MSPSSADLIDSACHPVSCRLGRLGWGLLLQTPGEVRPRNVASYQSGYPLVHLRRRPVLSSGSAFSARLRRLRAGERSIDQSSPDNALEGECETHSVSQRSAVEAERVFIEMTEQLERLGRPAYHAGLVPRGSKESSRPLMRNPHRRIISV